MEELDIIDVEIITGELKTDAMKIYKTAVKKKLTACLCRNNVENLL